MAKKQNAQPVDLTNCGREPIHIPGSIQPHGALLVCGVADLIVTAASANAADLLSAEKLVGADVGAILGADIAHDLQNALARSKSPAAPGLMFGVGLPNGVEADLSIHRHAGRTIVEIEPIGADAMASPIDLIRPMIERLGDASTIPQLSELCVNYLRPLIGYDRIMLYQFQHDGAGQVVAESVRGGLGSFYGMRFPQSDIPAQARELYKKNWIRVIADIGYTPSPIGPADASGGPIDLSFAALRSVSPIHVEYLQNMGVGASMSISIIVEGELWGLIACHHYSAKQVPLAARVAAELFGRFFSLQLEAVLRRETLERANSARGIVDSWLASLPLTSSPSKHLSENLDRIQNVVRCDGVALWHNGIWRAIGAAPSERDAGALAKLVSEAGGAGIFATHELPSRLVSADPDNLSVCGVMAVPLSRSARDYLYFFRKEATEHVKWAGDPNKPMTSGPLGDRLTPRKSFETWREDVRGQSEPWTETDRSVGESLRVALLEVALRHGEQVAEERRKADTRQRILNAELNHRVKNILALIQSLVVRGRDQADDLQTYVSSLGGRIKALAFAHDQMALGDKGGQLRALVDVELAPYGDINGPRIRVGGPPVGLDDRAFAVMALVIHEMATNAAKYGALANDAGRLEVTWRGGDGEPCVIEWRESGGPIVKPPERQGFGSVLIQRSIPHELQGDSDIAYEPEGVVAHFTVPARYLTKIASAQAPAQAGPPTPNKMQRALTGKSLLLVEDQMLIALDTEMLLRENGASHVEVAPTAADALKALQKFEPDVAILDVNLGNGTSLPVADELHARSRPFIFATGYGDSIMIPERFKSVPVVRKPIEPSLMLQALSKMLNT